MAAWAWEYSDMALQMSKVLRQLSVLAVCWTIQLQVTGLSCFTWGGFRYGGFWLPTNRISGT